MRKSACIYLGVMIASSISAQASVFLTRQGGDDCDPTKDWCVNVAPDKTIADGVVKVAGKGFIKTAAGEFGGPWDAVLYHSSLPFDQGVFFTPDAVSKSYANSAGLSLTSVTDTQTGQNYPLTGCAVARDFPNHTITQPGISQLIISKTATGYTCQVVN